MAKFSVRARAVDMLGRQQIAGIPTALHELFKNAHDAYAKHVEVDYFRSERLLILRDDGSGMSRSDFEDKWLTLGTESKVNANSKDSTQQTEAPRGLKPRKILGEKGIGRLAVAAIGPLVLVLTRPAPDETDSDELSVALVHWGLFEIPGVDLDAVEIPILSVKARTLPSREQIGQLVATVRASVDRLTVPLQAKHHRTLSEPLDAMEAVDPLALAAWLEADARRARRENPTLEGDGHGTHFIVAPVDPILDADIDTKGSWGSSPFQRLLLGFGNTIAGDDAEFTAEFRDHRADGEVEELIGSQSFFSSAEFEAADHHFEGTFDDFGQFSGTIQLYRGEPQSYVSSWPDAVGRPTECGPFKLKVAYLMGLAGESRLPRDEHAVMYAKLNRLGGLYIYRDGVRVLPYGNSDYDFINIEQRRTLKAQDWFFSYRRMIGWIEVSHENNSSLVEKAGREGFRENKPYRQFKSILENFFKQLAVDYFRPKSDLGEDFRIERDRRVQDADRLKKREQSGRTRKRKFIANLERVLEEIDHGKFEAKIKAIEKELERRLSALAEAADEAASIRLLEIETEFSERLSDIEAACTLVKPRGLVLERGVEDAWGAYEKLFAKQRDEVFEPARFGVAARIGAYSAEHGLNPQKQRRAVNVLEREKTESLSEVRRLRKEAEQAMARVQKAVQDVMRTEIGEYQQYAEELLVDLGRINLDRLPDEKAYEHQRKLERALDDRLQQGRGLIESMRDQLVGVAVAITERDDAEETAAALERRANELQDRLDLYTDLAQAGTAIGIVGHEFTNVAEGLQKALRRLKPWADGTPELTAIYDDIRSYFDELEGYLALFTPLSRRRYRKKVLILGAYIEKYIQEALGTRLDDASIDLRVTDTFRQYSIEGYTSTILGAALNIVDNASYWASTQRDDPRFILLDADANGLLFTNNGPGVPLRSADRIFDFGISTKPGGRGMGLAVSRDALRKIGFDLKLLNPGIQNHPVFQICPDGQPAEED